MRFPAHFNKTRDVKTTVVRKSFNCSARPLRNCNVDACELEEVNGELEALAKNRCARRHRGNAKTAQMHGGQMGERFSQVRNPLSEWSFFLARIKPHRPQNQGKNRE